LRPWQRDEVASPEPGWGSSAVVMSGLFELRSEPSSPVAGRRGVLRTSHGTVETPAFMPVGTQATVKALGPGEVVAAGAEMILVNAYHLYLRPGHEHIRKLGGVHRFMNWPGPVLSDSGGFQVLSLAAMVKVGEEGVRFRSHIDGSLHEYTPELAIEVQRALGVDIAMPLDQVVGGDASGAEAWRAGERTVRWFDRCRESAGELPVFAIVQGGTDARLRAEQARAFREREAVGYAIGGLSVGESKAAMWKMVEVVCRELPQGSPRYLMGVGSPEDLVRGVSLGVDMFDCVLPTRLGRTGSLFTDEGRVNIRNAGFKDDGRPLDEEFEPLAGFTWAYLHHLFRAEELLGYRLATLYNIRYVERLMARLRAAIESGTLDKFVPEFLGGYRVADEGVRASQRAKWRASGAGGGRGEGRGGPGGID